MPNAKDAELTNTKRILMLGKTGSGKTAQIWTLPGKKFVYIFDPNTLSTIRGLDIEYAEFMPDVLEMDAMLKGFNKGAMDDKLPTKTSKREPTAYIDWVSDLNKRVEEKYFESFQWLIFDSTTFISRAIMSRQLYINNRYGGLSDRADYRVVGDKIAELFSTINTMPLNIYATGHLQSYEDEKTSKVETKINLPGQARTILPLVFTDIFMTTTDEGGPKGEVRYLIRTQPEARGFQDIRTSMRGLKALEDVTIGTWGDGSVRYGIGKLLSQQRN